MFVLRNLNDQDASWIVEASKDPAIQQHTSTGGAQTEAAALALIRGTTGERKTWAVVSGDEPVGIISLHEVDPLSSTADVGYWVAPWARRRGAATAALRLVEEELRLIPGVRVIQLSIMARNEPSLALARALGFQETASGNCSCGTQGDVSAVIFEKTL